MWLQRGQHRWPTRRISRLLFLCDRPPTLLRTGCSVSSGRRVYFPALFLGPIAGSEAARRYKGRRFFGRRRDMTPFLESVAHGVALRSVVKQAPCVLFSLVSSSFLGGADL